MPRAIRIDRSDTVATAVEAVAAGETVTITGAGETVSLVAAEAVPQGHKLALAAIAAGDRVMKYGEVIGRATAAIAPGAHVHSHNLEGLRGRKGEER